MNQTAEEKFTLVSTTDASARFMYELLTRHLPHIQLDMILKDLEEDEFKRVNFGSPEIGMQAIKLARRLSELIPKSTM